MLLEIVQVTTVGYNQGKWFLYYFLKDGLVNFFRKFQILKQLYLELLVEVSDINTSIELDILESLRRFDDVLQCGPFLYLLAEVGIHRNERLVFECIFCHFL